MKSKGTVTFIRNLCKRWQWVFERSRAVLLVYRVYVECSDSKQENACRHEYRKHRRQTQYHIFKVHMTI